MDVENVIFIMEVNDKIRGISYCLLYTNEHW